MASATRKPAAKPAASAAILEDDGYDFDNWTQDDEDAALRRINDVKHIIVGNDFVGRFGDGEVVKIPLTLKLDMIDQLERQFSSPVDQFRHLLTTFCGEDVAASLNKRSLIPVAIMAEKYFRALGRAQELAFPES